MTDTQFECYKGLTGAELRQISRLVICVNSLPKLALTGQQFRHFDLIIIDEIEQVLAHLNGDTFKGVQAFLVYTVLGGYMKKADCVVAMDAHAGQFRGIGWQNCAHRLLPSSILMFDSMAY